MDESRGYIGANYGYDDYKYGIPVVEEGNIQLTPRGHILIFRTEGRDYSGVISSFRGSLGVRRYRHDGAQRATRLGTEFSNNTVDLELLATHRKAGRLTGSDWSLGFDPELRSRRRGSLVTTG